MGGSVTVGYGAGGSANFSQSKVNVDYAAVGEQAGIRAGDGGFQVSVKGNTDLKGGAITSSQAAIDAGKNSFSTGTLTSSDIDNRSQFSASAVTVSAGTSGGMAGAFKDSGDERSTTRSTISAGSTTITSGDAASQATLEKLDRGATNDATAGKLSQGWDGQKLAQQVKVNAQIVAEFGAQASKEVAGQLDKKAQQLRAEGKIDEAKKYEEGGEYRVAAHAVIGAITGDLSGALGAAAGAKLADQLNELQSTLKDRLESAGLGPDEKGNNDWATGLAKLATGALATATGAAVGGVNGGAAALNEDYNNRQFHWSTFVEKKNACQKNPNASGCGTIEKMAGAKSQLLDFMATETAKVVVNTDADGKVVSYTILDKATNQPKMIMEPADFQAFRSAPAGFQALMQLSPQYMYDLSSALTHGMNYRDLSNAKESLSDVVSSKQYWFDAGLGALGVVAVETTPIRAVVPNRTTPNGWTVKPYSGDALASDFVGPLDLNTRATLNVSTVTAPIDFDGHILSAELKANGNVVGGHSIASGDVKIVPGTASQPNAQGVYQAQIMVPDPANPGQFLPKTNNGGVSTMFPDSWSAARVKVEVDFAYQNRTINGNIWTGVTPSGVVVKGYINPKTTVYPIY